MKAVGVSDRCTGFLCTWEEMVVSFHCEWELKRNSKQAASSLHIKTGLRLKAKKRELVSYIFRVPAYPVRL